MQHVDHVPWHSGVQIISVEEAQPERLVMAVHDDAQSRADKKTLTIIISVVSLVVVAVTITVAVILMNGVRAEQAPPAAQSPSASSATSTDSASLFGDYAGGRPIVISHKGVGQADDSLPTVTEYFDHSCPGCVQLATAADADLIAGAQAGDYNLAFAAVASHNAAWNPVATAASVLVAKEAPDQWVAFHEALIAYYYAAMRSGDGTTVTDTDASLEQVRIIAEKAAVPASVIETFPVAQVGQEYLNASSLKWQESMAEGRTKLSTPELVVNATHVELVDYRSQTVMSEIRRLIGR